MSSRLCLFYNFIQGLVGTVFHSDYWIDTFLIAVVVWLFILLSHIFYIGLGLLGGGFRMCLIAMNVFVEVEDKGTVFL